MAAHAIDTSQTTHPGLNRDIEYANVDGTALDLDAFVQDTKKPSPAAILVHGGGWIAGDRRRDVQPIFAALETAGFAWFSIDYRLAKNALQLGDGIDDVQSAINFVKEHAAAYNVDTTKIALIGESAGGQLAIMAALRERTPSAVRAVVGLYAPADLGELLRNSDYVPSRFRDQIKGTPFESFVMAGLRTLSPIDNVRSDMPPLLLIHGTADRLVPFEQSTAMCKAVKSVGGGCELYAVRGAGHGIRWWQDTAYKSEMIAWLKRQLGMSSSVTS